MTRFEASTITSGLLVAGLSRVEVVMRVGVRILKLEEKLNMRPAKVKDFCDSKKDFGGEN